MTTIQKNQPHTASGDTPMRGRAVMYIRVACRPQDGDKNAQAIAIQRAACEHKAKLLGLSFAAEYLDTDCAAAISQRVMFQQMLKRIHRDKDISAVIVSQWCRLRRNHRDYATTMAYLRKQSVRVIEALGDPKDARNQMFREVAEVFQMVELDTRRKQTAARLASVQNRASAVVSGNQEVGSKL